MPKCTICGNKHDNQLVHLTVGEGGLELISQEEAESINNDKINPCWDFDPAVE